METMQVLTFLIVSLMSTIVSSSKCKNPELKCIELCCEKTKYYSPQYQLCSNIPDEFKSSLLGNFHDNRTVSEAMEFVEYGECENTIVRQIYISSCYSPYLNGTSNQFYFEQLFDVPCDRTVQMTRGPVTIIALICYSSLPICLPIMLVYTCIKGFKDKFLFKLVAWYLVSMTAYFGALSVFWLYGSLSKTIEEDFKQIYEGLYVFAFMSSYLWQNVIGFQIWSGFKQANLQNNSDKDQRRFVYYSVFVWSIAAMITSTHFLLSKLHWYSKVVYSVTIAIPCFNMLTFGILSLNICMTRCRVINVTQEVHFKRKLTLIILRLGLVMGIPRMLLVTLSMFFNVGRPLVAIFVVLEPYIVFTVLVWKPKCFFRWNFGCGSCRKSAQTSNETEMAYLTTD